MRFLPANADGLVIEVDDLDQALALFRSLRSEPIPGVEELVPAARTVYVRFRPWLTSRAAIAAQVRGRSLTAVPPPAGGLVRIPVHYAGEDLPDVAAICGLTVAEVVRRHTAATYTVAFTGFAPGFAYLAGGDPALRVPRRSTPRTAIPAGAVGVAGEFTGVYPRVSPGGWQLLGRTAVLMWDLHREAPALLQPGARVQFVDAGAEPATVVEAATAGTVRRDHRVADLPEPDRALVVVHPGTASVLQDLGRPGLTGMGVSRSGAMDRGSLRRANRLVGNRTDAPAVEAAAGGLRVRARGDLVVALAGAPVPVRVQSPAGARSEPMDRALALDDGETLELGAPAAGVHTYLAVRGSFGAEPVLGSLSGDVLAGIGPAPLLPGDVLALGDDGAAAAVAVHDAPPPSLPAPEDVVELDVVLGPRTDWCTPESLGVLTGQEWTVTPQSNRVGLRLAGPVPIQRAVTAELPSEATPAGALQVPPSGQPVLFMADHPLTGGYPVIGCVAHHHLDLAAQVPVTGRVRFRVIAAFSDQPGDAAVLTTAGGEARS